MTWVLSRFVGSDGVAGDREGCAVAADGNTVVVGAYYATGGGVAWAGAVYVFVRSGLGWTEQQILYAPDGAANDSFGARNGVAISGDTIVVGAAADDDAGSASGSAYVFVRANGVWTFQQKLTASDAAAGAYFGISVAIEDDTIVVGASEAVTALGAPKGQAYVFTRSGTVWTEQAILEASRLTARDFGWSVAINSGTIAIGAPTTEVDGIVFSAIYVFTGAGAVWTEEDELIPPGGPTVELVGWSIALNGDTIISGNPNSGSPIVASGAGTATVFKRTSTVWAHVQMLTEPTPELHGWFGESVGLPDESTLIVGAPYNLTGDGEAYIFKLGSTWALSETITPDLSLPNQTFGTGVAYTATNLLAIGAQDSAGTTPGGVYLPPVFAIKLPASALYIDEIRGE